MDNKRRKLSSNKKQTPNETPTEKEVEYVGEVFKRFQTMYNDSDFFVVNTGLLNNRFYKLLDIFKLNIEQTEETTNHNDNHNDDQNYDNGLDYEYEDENHFERTRGRDSKMVFLAFLFQLDSIKDQFTLDEGVDIKYFDKNYLDAIDYIYYDDADDFWISRSRFLCNTIKSSIHLSSTELGENIKKAWSTKPRIYKGEFSNFFTVEVRNKCTAIFQKYLKNIFMNKKINI